MPTIPDNCEFQVGADQILLSTQTNGDKITISDIKLSADAAGALAYMVNKTSNHLKIEIKEA